MIIWLTGPSGAGKTTAGRHLAALRRLPFNDLDELVERAAGASIEHIFSSEGESAFRSYEWNAILELVQHAGESCVVALGGGALTQSGVRSLVRATGPRVFLDIDAETALERLAGDSPRPLLFEEDPLAAWRRLYRTRRRHYDDCDVYVVATASPVEVARVIDGELHSLETPVWHIDSIVGGQPTSVEFNRSILRTFERIEEIVGGRRAVLAVDPAVAAELEDLIHDPKRHIGTVQAVEPGEEQKTLRSVELLLQAMSACGLGRADVLVAMGGGAVTDVAGLAGSLYMRGIETLYVPTTLLAQVDAAIGGKTAVNVAGVRNLAGTVHQPRHVLMCPAFLRTLTARELRSGFVEALKMGIANSESLAGAVQRAEAQVVDGRLPSNLEEVVRLSVRAKLDVVEQDAHDRSLRLSLNFGHTYAHALEAAEPDRHAHGEAVAFGILAATEMAAEVLNLSHERRTWIRDRSMPFALPVGAEHDISRIITAMTADKKRLPQMLRFVLPTEVTGCVIYETDDRELIARSIERASSAIASETLA